MIKVNSSVVKVEHFPDGTQRINLEFVANTGSANVAPEATITWKYENDEECITLWYVVNHIKNNYGVRDYYLILDYVPNARLDRTKKTEEVFTLKYFAEFINALNFNKVYVLDPHSDVSTALINNVVIKDVNHYISTAIWKVGMKENVTKGEIFVYFPDSGAMKRYKDLKCLDGHNLIYGKKVRDWETGKIQGLEVYDCNEIKIDETVDNSPINGAIVLMIDDIISYGGTMAYSADRLKKLGAKTIYAYATHVENSVLDEENGTLIKRLENGTVKCVFTTDSLFNKFEQTKLVEKI